MKQQYREKKFKKEFTITLSDKKTKWTGSALRLINLADEIVTNYMDMGIKMTLRQLFYRMVTGNTVPNDDVAYSKLSTLITDGRYAGLIDWDGIEDRGRPLHFYGEFDNLQDIVRAMRGCRFPRWKDQDYYVELFAEKDAISSILRPIASRWHIRYGFNKGYGSVTVMKNLADRIGGAILDEKEVVILYLGDHDPSGLDMVRDIDERVHEFLIEDLPPPGSNDFHHQFEIVPIALTKKQIKEYDPPPNPTKVKDPRLANYIRKHGSFCWEVDALEPQTMSEIVEDAIREYIDIGKWDDVIAREREQIGMLEKIAGESI